MIKAIEYKAEDETKRSVILYKLRIKEHKMSAMLYKLGKI